MLATGMFGNNGILWEGKGQFGAKGTKLLTILNSFSESQIRKGPVHRYAVLLYNAEGHGFDSRWCHWNFSVT